MPGADLKIFIENCVKPYSCNKSNEVIVFKTIMLAIYGKLGILCQNVVEIM